MLRWIGRILFGAMKGTMFGVLAGLIVMALVLAHDLTFTRIGVTVRPLEIALDAVKFGVAGLILGIVAAVARQLRDPAVPPRQPRPGQSLRRWLVALGVALVLVGVFFGLTAGGRAIVRGAIQGEPFARCQPLSRWIEELQSPDPDARQRAIDVLVEMGPDAQAAVLALGRMVSQDPDPDWRRNAAAGLRKLGPGAAAATDDLVQALARDPDDKVRSEVVHGLTELGPAAASAAPKLLTIIEADPTHVPKVEEIRLLAEPGWAAPAAMPMLIRALYTAAGGADAHDGSARKTVMEIIRALEAIGPAAAPELALALHQKDPATSRPTFDVEIRGSLIEALANTGPAGSEALVNTLDDKELYEPAARVLERLGPDAVSAVRGALANPKPEVRHRAARILGWIGSPAAPAVPDLLALLGSDDATLQKNAIYALGRIGREAAPAVPALIAILERKDKLGRDDPWIFHPRAEAATALADIGSPAQDALPALHKIAQEKPNTVGLAAAGAICRLEGPTPDAIEQFIHAIENGGNDRSRAMAFLDGPEPAVRKEIPVRAWIAAAKRDIRDASVVVTAMRALGERDDEPVAVVTALQKRLRDENKSVRLAAVRSLAQQARRAPAAVDALAAALDESDPDVTAVVVEGLRTLGPAALPALPALKKIRSCSIGWLRVDAAQALWTISGDATVYEGLLAGLPASQIGWSTIDGLLRLGPEARPAILEALRNGDSDQAVRLAVFLGEQGPPATDAVPDLVRLWERASGDDRRKVEMALKTIAPGSLFRTQFRARLSTAIQSGAIIGLAWTVIYGILLCCVAFLRRTPPRPAVAPRPVFENESPAL